MRLTTTFAAGAAWAVIALAAPADAGERSGGPYFRPHALPPVSGTLHVEPSAFGRGPGSHAGWAGGYGSSRIMMRPQHVGSSFGYHGREGGRFSRTAGGYGDNQLRHFGPRYGYQGRGLGQFAGGHFRYPHADYGQSRYAYSGGGYGYRYAAARREVGWQGDGTGLVGLIGNGGSGYDSYNTRWGTADAATTGGAYPLPSPAYHYRAEAPVQVTYGEPDLWTSGSGYAPTGGLGYYNSGSPGRMAYYGSSSSAGPGGTPGGLGIYSSGSYGPGPHVIRVGRRHYSRVSMNRDCGCGARVIAVHRQRHYARW